MSDRHSASEGENEGVVFFFSLNTLEKKGENEGDFTDIFPVFRIKFQTLGKYYPCYEIS
jgi:hypothetical protein